MSNKLYATDSYNLIMKANEMCYFLYLFYNVLYMSVY